MNLKLLLGLALGFGIGLGCAWFGIPAPAPPALAGALLVLAMTVGYVVADRYVSHREATQKANCGGPKGN